MSKAWEPQLVLRVGCLCATANKTKLRTRTVPGKRLATVSGKELKTRISILSRISSLGAAPTWGEGVENYGGEEALSVWVPAESQSCRWDLTGSGMRNIWCSLALTNKAAGLALKNMMCCYISGHCCKHIYDEHTVTRFSVAWRNRRQNGRVDRQTTGATWGQQITLGFRDRKSGFKCCLHHFLFGMNSHKLSNFWYPIIPLCQHG